MQTLALLSEDIQTTWQKLSLDFPRWVEESFPLLQYFRTLNTWRTHGRVRSCCDTHMLSYAKFCQEIKSFHFYGSCTTEQHCDVTQLAALGSPPTPKTQTRPEPKHQQSPTQECVGRSITLKEDFFTASSVFQPCDITGVPHFIY